MNRYLRPYQVLQPRLPVRQQIKQTRVGGGCIQNVLMFERNGGHVSMIV